jgi:hypothetical protein
VKRTLCVLLFLIAGNTAAADITLGRLFYTPEERAALEEARRRNIRAEEQAAEASKKAKPDGPRTVTLNGVVRRSDGESAIWVNGKPVENETSDGMRVRLTPDQAGVTVHDMEKGRTVRLKVGQHANLLTGKVEENYARREAPPPPAAAEITNEQATEKAVAPDNNGTSPQAGAEAPMRTARSTRRLQREDDNDGDAPVAAPDSSSVEQKQR